MKKLLLFALSIPLLIISPVQAQVADCGNGLPCGPIPWRMPVLPDLSSPTPMPTLEIPESNINPGEPTSTPAPINTATPIALDIDGIDGQLSLLNSAILQTPGAVETDFPLGLTGNVLLNGDFSSWSGGLPTNWNNNPAPPNCTISQETGGVRITKLSAACTPNMNQARLTMGQSYNYTIQILEITGSLAVESATNPAPPIVSTVGLHTFTNVPTYSVTFRLRPTVTPTNVVIASVTVQPSNTVIANLGTNANIFFNYARGLSGNSFGPLAPLAVLSVSGLVLILSVKLLTFFLPIISALFGIIRKIVTAILEFLPL